MLVVQKFCKTVETACELPKATAKLTLPRVC